MVPTTHNDNMYKATLYFQYFTDKMAHYEIHNVNSTSGDVTFKGVPYGDFDRTGMVFQLVDTHG